MPKIGTIFIVGTIGTFEDTDEPGVELIDVVSQVRALGEVDEYKVLIKSPGGYVHVGDEIYNYLESLKKPITTVGQGLVASMATVIFMVGQTRILQPDTEFMIHLPLGGVEGNSQQVAEYAKEMLDIEKRMIKFYGEKTGLTEAALLPFMAAETWLNPEQAFELGFTTLKTTAPAETAKKAIAKINLTQSKMSKQKLSNEEKGIFEKFFKKMATMLEIDKPKNIIIQDANGVDIDFTEVEEGESVAEGDTAVIDGQPAEGEYVLPSGETYVFSGGALTEIRPAEGGDDNEEMQALQQRIEELEASNADLQTQLTSANDTNETLQTQLQDAADNFKEFKATLKSKFDFTQMKGKKKEDKGTEEPTNSISSMKSKLKRNKNK